MPTRLIAILFLAACTLSVPASSQAGLVGTRSTVLFTEPGFDPIWDGVDITVLTELSAGDGSRIGDQIMLDFERIDIQNDSIVFDIRGDGPVHPDDAAYQTTGLGPLAQYQIKYLTWLGEPTGRITGVNVTLTDVIGVAVGQEVLFDEHSVTLQLGTLGIREQGGVDIGRVVIDLIVELPEATIGGLLLTAFAGLAFARFRAR